MQNNGTIWAHIFFTKPNKKPVPNSKDIILQKVVCKFLHDNRWRGSR